MAFWWAVHVLTRFGGTVNDPVTMSEMIFMTIVALFAFFWIAVVIGAVTEIIANLGADDTKQRRHILSLKSFVKNKDPPDPLQRKIFTYFDHVWSKYKGWDEDEILSWLPDNIKAEVNLVLSEKIIKKYHFSKPENQVILNCYVQSYTFISSPLENGSLKKAK